MIGNPYNPLEPTEDPTLFFGREEALAFVQLNLAGGPNREALVIVGQRGMGKSSLLTQIPLNTDERFVCVNVDISSIELDDPASFVAAVVDQTRGMLEVIEASTLRLPTFPDVADPGVDLPTWLADEYFEVVLAAIRRSRYLVLMLDDLHLLFDAVDAGILPADFMAFFGRLLERHDRLNLIATLDITYEARALQTPPFDEARLHFRLTNLSQEEASAVILKPVEGLYDFEPLALRQVLALAGGHPFHLHSFCRLLYRLYEQERRVTTIVPADIEAVYPATLEQAGEIVKPLWEHIRPNERLALTALLDLHRHNPNEAMPPVALREWLSKTDYPLSEIQLAAALRGLEYLGIVQTDLEGNSYFSSGIQADWLITHVMTLPEETKPAPKGRLHSRSWLLAAATAVIILGAVVLSQIIRGGEDEQTSNSGGPTATLQLDIDATRASDVQTQTAIAAPPTRTATPSPTAAPPFRFGG